MFLWYLTSCWLQSIKRPLATAFCRKSRRLRWSFRWRPFYHFTSFISHLKKHCKRHNGSRVLSSLLQKKNFVELSSALLITMPIGHESVKDSKMSISGNFTIFPLSLLLWSTKYFFATQNTKIFPVGTQNMCSPILSIILKWILCQTHRLHHCNHQHYNNDKIQFFWRGSR